MAAMPGGRPTVFPHVWRGALEEERFTAAERDQREFTNDGSRMAGRLDEARVLVVRDRKAPDEELADVDTVDWPFVFLRVGGPHQKVAGGDSCQIR